MGTGKKRVPLNIIVKDSPFSQQMIVEWIPMTPFHILKYLCTQFAYETTRTTSYLLHLYL